MKQLVINPGSTSTKIAVFNGLEMIFEKTLRHSVEELGGFKKVIDQLQFRKDIIMEALEENGIEVKGLSSVVGRGGLLRPMTGGTYEVSQAMLDDLKSDARGEHASNLGGVLAYEIASEENLPSFIVDPIVVDELEPIARLSGHPEFERKSIFHALNQKAVGRRAAKELGRKYEEVNLVVAHLGGGVSVGAHKEGRIIDVNNALDGEGPYSPERSGTLPSGDLVKMSFSEKKSIDEMKKMIKGNGGLTAYLGTNDARAISGMCDQGDESARLVYEGMAYQVAKAIGSYAVVLEGKVDAVVITGGIAYDKDFVSWIETRVGFISNILVYPGEDELDALAQGGLRVLTGEEEAKIY